MSTGPLPPAPFDQHSPPRPDRPGSRMPTLLSGLALIVALVAAGVSLVALSRTGDNPRPVATAAPAQPTLSDTPPSTDPTPTDGPTGATTDPTGAAPPGATDAPDPHGVYRLVYQEKVLRLQPSTQRYIDVDKPSADATGEQGELQYTDLYDPPRLQFGELPVAKLTSSNGAAGDCVTQLDTAPIDGLFTPAKGDLICLLTDGSKAVNEGISRKVALLRVDSIAPDGTLNLTVTAWNVPS